MKIFGLNITKGSKKPIEKPITSAEMRYGTSSISHYMSFDGEKNDGEIGPILHYDLEYYGLAARSWQAYMDSELAKTIMEKTIIWMIDKGLKLQASPAKFILENEGIKLDVEKFNTLVEARFSLWSNSKRSSFNEMINLNTVAKETFKNSIIGGDVLVVIRYVKGVVKVETIDGAHVGGVYNNKDVAKGNKVKDGVEYDSKNKHIAYHINMGFGKPSRRIKAWSQSTGLRVAFLVYGSKYRLNDFRGTPVISQSMESLKKIDRYKEATVGGAEERKKVAFAIEHDLNSDGENPWTNQTAEMFSNKSNGETSVPLDAEGQKLANQVAASVDKTVVNLPPGSKLVSMDSKQDLFFGEFYGTVAEYIASSVNIPPNVAFSMYNDSFSASRAATKDWDHTMSVTRDEFKTQFYAPIYAFWMHLEIITGKIKAPGYISAFEKDDFMIYESYLSCRFTGPSFPHIDPLKEVKAERAKLGKGFDHIPLTTIERATEVLDGGESNSNMEQASMELDSAKKLGLEPIVAADKNKEKSDGDGEGSGNNGE